MMLGSNKAQKCINGMDKAICRNFTNFQNTKAAHFSQKLGSTNVIFLSQFDSNVTWQIWFWSQIDRGSGVNSWFFEKIQTSWWKLYFYVTFCLKNLNLPTFGSWHLADCQNIKKSWVDAAPHQRGLQFDILSNGIPFELRTKNYINWECAKTPFWPNSDQAS